MSLNRIDVSGRLIRDAELRTSASGKSVVTFTVAVDRDFKKDGADNTDFINCVAFDKKGEFIQRNFSKGSMIIVSGRLQSNHWTDKNDNKRTDWNIMVENVYFGGSKSDNHSATRQAPNQNTPEFVELEDSDVELPFDVG